MKIHPSLFLTNVGMLVNMGHVLMLPLLVSCHRLLWNYSQVINTIVLLPLELMLQFQHSGFLKIEADLLLDPFYQKLYLQHFQPYLLSPNWYGGHNNRQKIPNQSHNHLITMKLWKRVVKLMPLRCISGFVCVRGFDMKDRALRPLRARLHFLLAG